jgi:hypothetical protein
MGSSKSRFSSACGGRARLAILLMAFCLISSPLSVQGSGFPCFLERHTVYDSSGAVLPAATVAATNLERNAGDTRNYK